MTELESGGVRLTVEKAYYIRMWTWAQHRREGLGIVRYRHTQKAERETVTNLSLTHVFSALRGLRGSLTCKRREALTNTDCTN